LRFGLIVNAALSLGVVSELASLACRDRYVAATTGRAARLDPGKPEGTTERLPC